MEIFLDIIKIAVPALLVFFTAWFLLRNMIRDDQDKRRQELILQNSRTILPIRLQAYERIVLFLEAASRSFAIEIISRISFTVAAGAVI